MNIFVGNLSFQTTSEELNSAFSAFGTVDKVNVITDRETGRSRGFAFVEMSNRTEGENAIAQLNGTELGGRRINVNEARPKPGNGGGAGGHGGGGGGGRRFGGGGGGGGRREPRW